MLWAWVARLELARDDGGSLSDEGIVELTDLLTKSGLQPIASRPDPGTVLIQMRLEARNETEAKSAAQRALRDQANTVWARLGLPPFTITFVDAKREALG